MRTPRDGAPRFGLGAGLLVVMWLLAALLFAAVPLGAGVVVACVVPGLGGLRPGLGVVSVACLVLAVLVIGVVVGERPVRIMRLLLPGHPRLQRAGAELVTFALMSAALLVPLVSVLGSVTAAAVACAGYKLLEPLLRDVRTRRR
jgi:hypothetical protein